MEKERGDLILDKKILLVEDEIRMRFLLSDYFRKEGFKYIEATNGIEALQMFELNKVDLVVLDIMLPRLDGFEVCKEIRKKSNVPIILLTAKSEEDDKLLGYEIGADDYVTKPFSPKVLMAKIKTLFKRLETLDGNNISSNITLQEFNGLIIDELSHDVKVNNESINLTPKEFDLLLYIIKNKNIALSREQILDNVWGFDYFGDTRTVDTNIKRLREKLKDKSSLITTVRGSGYKFEVKDEK